MLLFTILLIILAMFLIASVLTIIIGGAGFIMIFGDVLICVLLIVFIVKLIKKLKKKK